MEPTAPLQGILPGRGAALVSAGWLCGGREWARTLTPSPSESTVKPSTQAIGHGGVHAYPSFTWRLLCMPSPCCISRLDDKKTCRVHLGVGASYVYVGLRAASPRGMGWMGGNHSLVERGQVTCCLAA